ncbi:FtsX-like permease family protein [Nesterenkonia sp. MY13]|uniref:FtsX-like permease family protein n=1 Tax=Nesterenkonia sedimenti TaxID=1463632 RepID=A0A7X8TLQ2_9MICC|nr:ABC transporter permease [Nesterenkonia sedimenti]NLS10894.1 FtsX-like permease family protein [Nesterenkonia sedimenti]
MSSAKNAGFAVLRANLRSSGRRLWAAGAAVAVSVAFIVTGLMLVDSMTRAVTQQAEQDAAGADLVVMTDSLIGASDSEEALGQETRISEAVAGLDSVEGVEPVREAFIEEWDEQTNGLDRSIRTRTLVSEQHTPDEQELAAGRLPTADDELLISQYTAEFEDLSIGDTVAAAEIDWDEENETEELIGHSVEYTVVGISEYGDFNTTFMTPAGMDRMPTDPAPHFLRVELTGAAQGDSQAQEDAQQQIAQVLAELAAAGQLPTLGGTGEDTEVLQSPGSHGTILIGEDLTLQVATHQQIVNEWVADQTGDAQIMQWIAFGFGGIAIVVSALVILNTFQVIVASRQHTMALIRAVGGTAAQLRRATLAEGALLGLIGGAVGIFLGWGVAQALTLLDDYIPPVIPTPTSVGIGLGLGVLMSVACALIPAVRAGRTSPMAALAPADVAPRKPRPAPVRTTLGALMAILGLVAVFYAALTSPDTNRADYEDEPVNYDALTGLPLPVLGVLGGLVSFFGLLMLARRLMPPAAAWLGRTLAATGIAKVPAKIAGENTRQVPGRTAATSGALLVGVTLVVTMTVGAATAQKMLYDELAESYPVDGIIAGDHSEALEEEAAVAATATVPTAEVSIGDQGESAEVFFLNRSEHSAVFHGGWPFDSPGRGESYQAFGSYYLLPFTEQQGQDDVVNIEFPNGAEVSFTLQEGWSSMPGMMIAIDAGQLRETPVWFGAEEGETATLVRLAGEPSASEIMQLEEIVGTEESVTDIDQMSNNFEGGLIRAAYVEVIDMVLMVVIGLLGASVLIALIGVSNTLSLSVLERRREAGLLRATGMTRRSVGAMVSIEALLLAGVALILGTVLGSIFGWAGISSLIAREDWTVVPEIPWLRLAAIWAVTLLAALAAAWLPARRLAKTQPAAALAG